MGKYDDLLEEVRSRAAAYISTAKIYIPKMYEVLMNESIFYFILFYEYA